jgi:hypothetical protein
MLMDVKLCSLCCGGGTSKPVNWFLSLPVFRPLSRLTYTAYLLHPLLINWAYQNQEVSSLGRYVFGSEISYNKAPPRLPGLGC